MSITRKENLTDKLIKIRHYLHEHPELSDHEFETTKYLVNYLNKIGYRIVTPTTLKTGVIAEIGPKDAELVIGLRADIDALPIQETTGLSFSSINDNVMHACGHDLHITGLLGAATLFANHISELKVTIRLIFQPSEELHTGARQVIQSGGIKKVSALIGFHNKPDLKYNEVSILYGGQMAAVDQFKVTLKGKGTHAAMPHLGSDPIIGLTSIVNSLQTIVSRNIDPQTTSVLSVTHISAGNTWNVIPSKSFFEGTNRNFSISSQIIAKKRFYQIVNQYANALGLSAQIEWISGPKVVLNNHKLATILIDETKKHAHFIESSPSNAGEDFADYTDKVPSVFAFIGSDSNSDWHHSDLIVSDKAINTISDWYYFSALRLQTELLNELLEKR